MNEPTTQAGRELLADLDLAVGGQKPDGEHGQLFGQRITEATERAILAIETEARADQAAQIATLVEALDEVLGADTYRLRVDDGSQCKFCADPLTWHEKGNCTWRKAEKSLADLASAAEAHDAEVARKAVEQYQAELLRAALADLDRALGGGE
jgi:hypothetical protein